MKATYLQGTVLNSTRSNKSYYDSNNINCELKLKELSNTIIHISTPHNSLYYTTEVIIRQNNIWCFFCDVSTRNTLEKEKEQL